MDGAQDWDLALRVREEVGRARIVHVPHVLYHWREGRDRPPQRRSRSPRLARRSRRCSRDALARRGETSAERRSTPSGWRIAYALPDAAAAGLRRDPHARPRRPPARVRLVARRAHRVPALEILLVDNDSRDPKLRRVPATSSHATARRAYCAYPHAFNYSAQCNLGVREARGSS